VNGQTQKAQTGRSRIRPLQTSTRCYAFRSWPVNMSAVQLLREVMSAPHDPVRYDTDTVSVTSTVDDAEEQIFFHSECIIAERDQETCYLVKWEDYPLDE
jgi:hypothetical protein